MKDGKMNYDEAVEEFLRALRKKLVQKETEKSGGTVRCCEKSTGFCKFGGFYNRIFTYTVLALELGACRNVSIKMMIKLFI